MVTAVATQQQTMHDAPDAFSPEPWAGVVFTGLMTAVVVWALVVAVRQSR